MAHGESERRAAELASSPGPGGLRLPVAGGGLRDLWDVYDAHYDEITAAVMDAVVKEGEGAVLAQSIRAYQRSAGSAETNRRLMRSAMLDGDWDPHVASIRGLGAFYAREGLAFRVWPMSLHAFWTELRSRVVATHERDATRLMGCVASLQDYVNLVFVVVAEEYLREREATIRRQHAIRELSTPVLPLKPGLLVVPIIGIMDAARAQQLRAQLLAAVSRHRARVVVLDVTGVAEVDSGVAGHLTIAVGAAMLMGARSVVCGLSAASADALVQSGADLSRLATANDLQDGIRQADAILGASAASR
jgi:rsbT co-antagonist protein RsbR